MKKTIIAILALSGMVLAETEPKDLLFTSASGDANQSLGMAGFSFVLSANNDRLDMGDKTVPTSTELTLTNITFDTHPQYDNGLADNLILYVVDSNNKLVAVSEKVNGGSKPATNSTASFAFLTNPTTMKSGLTNTTNATLTMGETYRAFVANTANFHSWNAGVKNIGDTVQYFNATNIGMELVTFSGEDATNSALTVANDLYSTAFQGQYTPKVSITTTYTVPEPATATLSLLALAGLAARRRRH